MSAMRVEEIWRYPVKSMAGERLEAATLTADGIEGDRIVYVAGLLGRVLTARRHPRLLGHKGTLGPGGEPLVDGRPWDAESVQADVAAAAGRGARLVRTEGTGEFDKLPLLVATDGAVAAFGHDRRRLRPNVLVSGVEGLEERNWEGRRLRLGACVIFARNLRQRCVMTTYDPDTQAQDPEVLARIAREFEGSLALDCAVVLGGVFRVGDPVELLPDPAPR